MPGTNNPYKNRTQILKEKGVTHIRKYLNDHIKEIEVKIIISDVMELNQYLAFEEGKKAGKNELRNDLKELLDIEENDFFDTNEDM
jgi:REP element-mobilizing transposase RayT